MSSFAKDTFGEEKTISLKSVAIKSSYTFLFEKLSNEALNTKIARGGGGELFQIQTASHGHIQSLCLWTAYVCAECE